MSTLSENVKVELANLLNDKKSAMFVSNGKLFSLMDTIVCNKLKSAILPYGK